MMNSVIYINGLALMFQGKATMVEFAAVLVASVEQRMTTRKTKTRTKTKKTKLKKMKLNR